MYTTTIKTISTITFYTVVFVFCLSGIAFSQVSSLPASKTNFYVEKGKKAFEELKYQNAITNFQKATKKQATQNNANYGLAMSYLQNSQYKSSLNAFEKLSPELFGHDFFLNYLYTLKANGKYKEALEKSTAYMKNNSDENNDIYNFLENLKSVYTIGKNPWEAKISFVNFNSSGRDYSPMIVGNKLVYLSNKKASGGIRNFNYHFNDENNNTSFTKLYIIDNIDKITSQPINTNDSNKVNVENNNAVVDLLEQRDMNLGPVAFTKDNKTIYYTLNYKIRNKVTSWLRIMKADFSNGKITKSVQFPHNNQDFAIEHPAITPDGRFLFFTSNKTETGFGGFDLYRCESTGKDGDWKYPINLGEVVNTKGNEMFPYIDAKGFLFFASDRLPGLGGLDLFRVKLMNGLPAGKPENLGAPMNSTFDDFGITFTEDGKLGFFSSNRRNENDDIYQFSINIKDGKTKYIGGIVYDDKTKLRLFDAALDFKFAKEEYDFTINSDTAGAFNTLLDNEIKNVQVTANKEGYEQYVANVKTDSIDGNSLIIYLKPKIDSSLLVNNEDTVVTEPDNNFTFSNGNKINSNDLKHKIFYGFNESRVLGQTNLKSLERAARDLEENPNNVIIIASFTDCVGSSDYNDRLSAKRSESVRKILLSRGIAANRIKVYNYGEKYLIEQCKGDASDKQGQAVNRRSDIYISPNEKAEKFDPLTDITLDATKDAETLEEFKNGKIGKSSDPVFSLKYFKSLNDTLLHVIYFNQNKTDIDNSFGALANLKEFLRINKEFKINLRGHADIAELDEELHLSKQRIEIIRRYFSTYFIDPSRITYEVFGKKKQAINSLIDKNVAWKNRRVEVRIFR